MPHCRNCGAHVTEDYVRVLAPPEADTVRACPDCPDMIRTFDGSVREARSPRHQTTEHTEYDPEYATDGGQA